MQHRYSSWPRRVPRPLAALGLLLATAGAAHAQYPTPTFAPAATYSTGGNSPLSLAVADVNGDGQPDLLTVNYYTNDASVLLGNGNGTFQAATTYGTGGSEARRIAVADVNGDGKPDILTANESTHNVSVLLGNGNGTFQAATTYGTGSGSLPDGVAAADVNGDGKLDLLTANYGTNNVSVLPGNGNGTFGAATTYSTGSGSGPRSLAVADVNGDGKLDVLTGNYSSSTAGVLLGNGNGSFQAATTYGTGSGSNPFGIAVADVNGDGQPDLLTANSSSGTVGVLLGNGNGSFQAVTPYGKGIISDPLSIAVADVNGDSKPDLLTATPGPNSASVLLGYGTGYFQAVPAFGTGTNSQPFGLAVADVNGDGKPDLLTANGGSNTVGVLLNTTAYAAAAPTVTLLSPATGPVGTQVTISGTNLNGATAVRFNGTAASSFVVNSATSITAVVAAGTTTGPVSVTTASGTVSSATSFVVRVAPVTVADAYSTPQGITLTGNVLANDLGTNLRAILINRPTHGTLVLNPDGSFNYQPATGYSGQDSFTYYACNLGTPLVCGDPVTVSITVQRVAPITVADSYSTPQGVMLTGNVLTNDIGTNPRAILINRPTRGTLVLNPDGSFSYQPNAGFLGSDSFTYYACNMGTPLVCGAPATVSITVTSATSARSAAAPAQPAVGATAELALTGSPNPFSEQLRLSFALPTAQAYILAVYDAQGRLVKQLAHGHAEAGQMQELAVPTQGYATGLYLVRLSTATGTQLLKLLKQ